MTDEERRELARLQWGERQIAETVKEWRATSDGHQAGSGYARALNDCAQEITDIMEASFEPGFGLKPQDHAAALAYHAGALVAEVEQLRAQAAAT